MCFLCVVFVVPVSKKNNKKLDRGLVGLVNPGFFSIFFFNLTRPLNRVVHLVLFSGGSTGSKCISSCKDQASGSYQSCDSCEHFIMCSNGQLTKVDCAGGTVWNDNAKTCDWTSDTCSESGKNNYVSLVNPCPAKLNNLNFHPLEVVYRYRDPQLQVAKNYSYLFHLSINICKYLCLDRHFIPNSVKLNDLDLLCFHRAG